MQWSASLYTDNANDEGQCKVFVISWISDGKNLFCGQFTSRGGEFKRQVQETDSMGTLASILISMLKHT